MLIDFDKVCITNSNRQLHAMKGTIGKLKVEVMAERHVTIGGTKMLTIEATNANGNTAGNGIDSQKTSGTNTISAKVGLASSQTWTVAGGGTLTVSGAVTDFGGGYSLTKAGLGDLNLSGVNTYSGATNITAGILRR